MRASEVLQKCLGDCLGALHALRCRTLLRAVEALLSSGRLTLIDVARAWPGAERVRAPLKAFDRLLSNRHLHREREQLYAGMARWLLQSARPVVVIDWSDLKDDRRWCLLRAAVPIGGRTLPVLDMVFAGHALGSPAAEQQFLQRLQALMPPAACPILVTDAGFRSPWFNAVSARGWHWLGRLRHNTLVKPVAVPDREEEWVPSRALYVLASAKPFDLGSMHLVRSAPLACRMVVVGKRPQGRKHRTRLGAVARNSYSRKAAAREREPWLLVASPELALSTRQLVTLYSRRMQIEASFRDLKSHRYGQGFEDSLTRKGNRIEILLLIHALASFVSWLAGMACEATGIADWLQPTRSRRKLYSVLRIGREALVRRWPMTPVSEWLQRLRSLPKDVLDQMSVAA